MAKLKMVKEVHPTEGLSMTEEQFRRIVASADAKVEERKRLSRGSGPKPK